jgi:hypothetical protein
MAVKSFIVQAPGTIGDEWTQSINLGVMSQVFNHCATVAGLAEYNLT